MLQALHVNMETPEGDLKDTLYLCAHWKAFPPIGHRGDKVLSPAETAKVEVWQRVCGIPRMNADKCLSCEHVRKVRFKQGVAWVDMPDGSSYPLVEKALLESCPKNRDNLVRGIRPAGASRTGWSPKVPK